MQGLWKIRDCVIHRPGLVVLCCLPRGEECPICIFVAGRDSLFATLQLHFLTGAGRVHLLLVGCVPRETVDFCCESDILFMATTLVETNRQIDRGLEMFPLCPSKGFLECSLQVGFQPMNKRRMHGLSSLLSSCLSYIGFRFRCPLG